MRAGVTKIRLTGGEPTVRKDIIDIAQGLGSLPGLQTLAITSNGINLNRQLPALKAAGLSALNISLDTLQPERFEQMTRRPAAGHGKVMAAIENALRMGYDPVKVGKGIRVYRRAPKLCRILCQPGVGRLFVCKPFRLLETL